MDSEGRPTTKTSTGPHRITEPQLRRLLKIARDVGWKKSELVRYLRDVRKLSPAPGKPADMWHLSAAILQEGQYDQIVSEINKGVQ